MLIGGRSGAYQLKKALEIANILQNDPDNDCEYKVIDCKNGLGRIDVYDNEGFLIQQGLVF